MRHGRPRCECGCGNSGSSSLNTGWRCPCGRSWTAARPFGREIRCATYCMSTSASFRTRSRLRGGRQTRRTGNRRTPLPFLSRKKRKQKKVDCGGAALLFFSRARRRVTQNGRFTYEPSVFRAGKRGKPSYLQDELSPQSLLFRFFKKEKEAKESRFRRRGSAVLQQGSPRCYTKRTIHIRTVRFSCREVRGNGCFRRTASPRNALCFLSSRKAEKRDYSWNRAARRLSRLCVPLRVFRAPSAS